MTKPAKKAPNLSHDAIVTAALRLVDREGLDEFSLRKLGKALGCEAMAIYWYFESKDALFDAVVDKLTAHLGTVVGDRDPADWIAVLREVAHAYRKIALAHPSAFPLLATRRFASEGTYAFMERLFVLARGAGIPDDIAARFYRVVSSYMNGFALNELATLRGAAPRTAALRKKFTRVAEVAQYLEPDQLDDMFEFGLEIQLQALARATR
jgi:AcrR family transcriptional regulator